MSAIPLLLVLTRDSAGFMLWLHLWKFEFISTPPGEAPEHIRKAWVGLVLPLAVSGQRTRQTVGVLSRPNTFFGLLFALLTGRTNRHSGYIVDAHRAVEILASYSPDAAKWWRENAANSIKPGRRFLFSPESCQELPS